MNKKKEENEWPVYVYKDKKRNNEGKDKGKNRNNE